MYKKKRAKRGKDEKGRKTDRRKLFIACASLCWCIRVLLRPHSGGISPTKCGHFQHRSSTHCRMMVHDPPGKQNPSNNNTQIARNHLTLNTPQGQPRTRFHRHFTRKKTPPHVRAATMRIGTPSYWPLRPPCP